MSQEEGRLEDKCLGEKRGTPDLTAKIETGDPQGFSNLTAGKQVKQARRTKRQKKKGQCQARP